jgi:lysophospholipid acyltransferase (LPLAT)-like uncharacterized protein
MKLRHPWLIRLLGFAGSWLIRGWLGTLRFRLDASASGGVPFDPRRQRLIYAFWHEYYLLTINFRDNIQMLVSKHADGELITRMIQHLGVAAVRGSSRRGGAAAMLDMIRNGCRRHIAITPDGPCGPRRRVQPGAVFLASKTGLPIIPIGIALERAWRFKSWDRFALPHPYSLVKIITGAPVWVPERLDDAGMESYRALVEERLNFLTENAERWLAGKPRLAEATAADVMLARSA